MNDVGDCCWKNTNSVTYWQKLYHPQHKLQSDDVDTQTQMVDMISETTSTKGTMDPEGARLLTYSTIMSTVSPACA